MRKISRTRRILRRCALGLVVVLVAAALGVWWAHRHLERLIIASFNRTYPGLALTTKRVALTGTGKLDLKSVRVQVRSDGSEVLTVPEAKVRFSWGGIQSHFIREITIESPRINVTDQLLAALPADDGENSPGTPWRIGRVAIQGGSAQVNLAAFPEARCGFHVELTEGTGTNEITVTSLSVHTRPDNAEALSLPALKIRASLDDLRQQHLREVLVDAPRLVLTDRLLASLPAKTSAPSSAPAWTVDALRLDGGQATIDFAAWPRADFAFAAQLRARQPLGGTPGELSLSALHLRLRGSGADALSIPSVKALITLEGLQAHQIGEVTVESPQLDITQPLLTAFSSPSVPSVPSVPAEPTPWKLQRLTLTGGQATVDLPGAPLVQFAFAAQLGDDLLPPREPSEAQGSIDFTDIAVRSRQAPLAPFLRVPAVRTKFRLPEIQREHRIAWVQIDGFDFRFNRIFRDLIASGQKPALTTPDAATPPAKPARPYSLGELLVTDGSIHLDDLGLGLPSIGCRVNTSFRNLALAPDAGEGGQELQTIELSRIALTSPLDPFVSVLSLETVFIRFTLAGIWHREIEEIAIIRPRLDIGPDLFWYIDRVQKNETAPPPGTPLAEPGPSWQVHNFSATSGQLYLALEGHSEVALPMPFETHAENLNFQKLSDLRLKLLIDMPVQDYNYPDYELSLLGVGGRVEFSLPPAQGANNVVNTLHLREVRWKQFQARELFLDVTYDEHGIYGNLGGKSYGGLMRGQFNFLLGADSPWNGWLSGTHIDLKPVTDILAPEKFSLSSPANFRLTIAARASSIDQVDGDFKATRPGQLHIGKIDDIIKDLPGDWSGLKRGLSRISLEALRDFAYDTAHGDFRFHGLTGALHLDLRGPTGARAIEVDFHDDPAPRKGGRVAAREP